MIPERLKIEKLFIFPILFIDFTKLEKIDDENIYKYLNLTEEDIQTIEERCEKLKLLKL